MAQVRVTTTPLTDILKRGNYKHVAIVVAEAMILMAEPQSTGLNAGHSVFRGSLPMAMQACWPREVVGTVDKTHPLDGLRKQVSRELQRHGFKPTDSPRGWLVPDQMPAEWDTDLPTEEAARQAAEQTTGGPVETTYV